MPAKSVSVNKLNEEKKYIEDLSLHEQILHRPETYVGNIVDTDTEQPIWVNVNNTFINKIVKINDGLIRTFIEPASNAFDNIWRSNKHKMTYIKFKINKTTGKCSVKNDGAFIPIKQQTYTQEKTKLWVPTIAFGKLLTSTNYNDNEKRKTSGRNGYGIKLTNIFSKEFVVECCDGNKKFIQKWNNNMKTVSDPKITDTNSKPYTLVEWLPDFNRFKSSSDKTKCLNNFTNDHISYIERLIYHYATCASMYKVKVYYNNNKINIKNLKDFAMKYFIVNDSDELNDNDLSDTESVSSKSSKSSKSSSKYTSDNETSDNDLSDMSDNDLSDTSDNELSDNELSDNETTSDNESTSDTSDNEDNKLKRESLSIKTKNCLVFITPNDDNKYINYSSVNGIETPEGGLHLIEWEEKLFRPIVDFINGKDKIKKTTTKTKKKPQNIKIDINTVKNKLSLFVVATVENPQFESQEKRKLIAGEVDVNVKDTIIKKLKKWNFIKEIKAELEGKSFSKLNDLNKDKSNIENLEHCDYIRKNKSKKTIDKDCILVATEGDSAKTFITSGINKASIFDKRGREFIGIFKLKGKPINARKATVSKLEHNKEISTLIRALRLNTDLDYTDDNNYKTLYYKKFVICADADNDGYHIVALVYNFFHSKYPSLIKRGDFFYFMRTPVLTILKPWTEFYFLNEARNHINENEIHKNNIKYFKGLGSWPSQLVPKVLGKKLVCLITDEIGDKLIKNIFGKDESDFRKIWLTKASKPIINPISKDYEIQELADKNFINNELINFSKDHCRRAIPNLYDGLNESQRKILFTAFTTNLTYNKKVLKVSQFAGKVAELSEYHHGEVILNSTITGMTQRFVGSNNIPYFYDEGQFGSRIENGKDSANGRYIFTKLDNPSKYIFKDIDDPYLNWLEEDGNNIEPEYYLPILPMVLVNGRKGGIGTGFSSTIPSYNPLDLIKWINFWLDNNFKNNSNLIPWYRNFKGSIEIDPENTNKYIVKGVMKLSNKSNEYIISELPIGKNQISITKYTKFLESLEENKKISGFSNKCDNNNICYIITKGSLNITVNKDGLVVDDKILKSFKLLDTIHTSNMVLFTDTTTIKKYNNVIEILNDYCKERYKYYGIRRQGQINSLKTELEYVNNKLRFIKEVKNKTIDLDKIKSITELEDILDVRKYKRQITKKNTIHSKEVEEVEHEEHELVEEDNNKLGNYNYLTNINIKSMLREKDGQNKLQLLHDNLTDNITKLSKLTDTQYWKNELNEFIDIYNKWNDLENKRLTENIVSEVKSKKNK
jgi:DNA topoisomerase-2